MPSQGRRQGADPVSISSIKEATIFSSAVGPWKDLCERDWDAAMAGKSRDARVVPRAGKGGADFGLDTEQGSQRLSWITGTLVYVLVLIATVTLDELAIPAHSGPATATAMLAQMLVSLPQIITALLIVVVVRFEAGLVERVLAGVGFNRSTSGPTRERMRPGADTFPAYCP
ncbi:MULTISPECIES: hypothetical protein [unclassified Synechococcus]|uniref:hypothetical protein n=1 Tax=unclassified Synechococcus TaxID=2626047 RepID=UPI000069894F|nr:MULTISPECIES: hypothetical protein [unclassified Synechococcus]EAQ74732.1 hypothetical protein WH5701_10994 [Synechococcus sp. WH 5701]WFN60634.1 hypothetical protein N4320_09895 [Synechococcus sp. CCFWC 502]